MLEDHIPAGRALPFLIENGRVTWRDGTIDHEGDFTVSENIMPSLDNRSASMPSQNGLIKSFIRNNIEENSFVPIMPKPCNFF